LIKNEEETYSDTYWEKRVVAPHVHATWIGRELKGLELTPLLRQDWNGHFDDIFSGRMPDQDPCFTSAA
jgi:phytoene desaturase